MSVTHFDTEGISMSPVIFGFGALDVMIAAQAAYAVAILSRSLGKRKM